jgi:short subunit dehydrogenase-like uncharacterized protein
MSKRIVVVGGAGHLGRRAAVALKQAGGADVVVAGRRGPDLVVDLKRPETFAALRGASLVVNASSSHTAPPDELARFCLQEGLVLLEASSDRVVVERLLALQPQAGDTGAVVLGAGIFTGLSNLLGKAAVNAVPGADRLDIGIRSSPFSGAGQGTIDLMVDALAVPARAVVKGEPTITPAALPGPVLPFPRGKRRTLTFSFPEVTMLAKSTGVPDVHLGFAPAPSFLWPSFRYLPGWLLTAAPFRAFLRWYFIVLRRLVLGAVAGRVELVARAVGPGGEAVRTLVADDGFAVGGAAIAVMAQLLAERGAGPGVVVVDEVLALADVQQALTRLDPELMITFSGAD